MSALSPLDIGILTAIEKGRSHIEDIQYYLQDRFPHTKVVDTQTIANRMQYLISIGCAIETSEGHFSTTED
jgi:hypothetical protein